MLPELYKTDKVMVLIIDNYDSFTYNLVHLVAENSRSYTVVRNDEITTEAVAEMKPDGILISPGPGRPHEAGITESVIKKYGHDIPILGVCLGFQAIGEVFGASVIHAPTLMHGKTSRIFHDSKSIFNDVEQGFTATRYHSLVLDIETIPDEIEMTARTSDGVLMGLRHKSYPLEGIQFHPESILTKEGPKLIANWMKRIKD